MSQRSPLYAEGNLEPDLKKFSDEHKAEAKQLVKRSMLKWLIGWMIYAAVVVWFLSSRYNFRLSMYYSGYVIAFTGGLLAYGSAMGGNYTNVWGIYSGQHDLVTRDIRAARGRMFGQWLGPIIGVIFGFVLLVYYY